jgi:galactonate dehydratase
LVKITDVKVHLLPVDFRTWLLVKVETDEPGLFGWGEATLEWKARSVSAAIEELRELCLGEDPEAPRRIVRKLTKRHFWRPGIIGMSAISGIEMACWDITGKLRGRPVADLFGGRLRDRIPVYTHLGYGASADVYDRSMEGAIAENIAAIAAKGYHGVKVVNVPFHSAYVFAEKRQVYFDLLDAILDQARGRIDVALDVHGRCGAMVSAETLLSHLDGRDLLFVEEVLQPGSAADLARLSGRYRVKLATGERLVDRSDFVDLGRADAVSVFQPDIAHCGGISAAMEIATLASAFSLSVAPHNPLGLVASTVGLHFGLTAPAFLIQEEMSAHFAIADDFIQTPIRFRGGFWELEPCTGLGLEIDEAFLERLAGRAEPLITETAWDPDGSIADW